MFNAYLCIQNLKNNNFSIYLFLIQDWLNSILSSSSPGKGLIMLKFQVDQFHEIEFIL